MHLDHDTPFQPHHTLSAGPHRPDGTRRALRCGTRLRGDPRHHRLPLEVELLALLRGEAGDGVYRLVLRDFRERGQVGLEVVVL